jgi:hypothetical protein
MFRRCKWKICAQSVKVFLEEWNTKSGRKIFSTQETRNIRLREIYCDDGTRIVSLRKISNFNSESRNIPSSWQLCVHLDTFYWIDTQWNWSILGILSLREVETANRVPNWRLRISRKELNLKFLTCNSISKKHFALKPMYGAGVWTLHVPTNNGHLQVYKLKTTVQLEEEF